MLEQSCPDGEIGRRSGLKIRRPQGRGGSSPPLGTNKINHLCDLDLLPAEPPVRLVLLLVPFLTVSAPFGARSREINQSIGRVAR
jgi:hypothetical protein